MNNHVKKMIAPIIISAIIVIYYIYFGYIIYTIGGILSLPVKILGLGIPLVFIGASIFVLRERIKEIRSGEEDDLSKY